MYPYFPLPPNGKNTKAKAELEKKLSRVKKLDLPVLIAFTVFLLVLGMTTLGLSVTAHIKLEEKKDAGLKGDLLTDLRTVTIAMTVVASVQTVQSIFALVAVTIHSFTFLVMFLVTGVLAMVGNVAAAGYSFHCMEQTDDYVENHHCSICEVSHDVVFKYALPAMCLAMATVVFHAITYIAIYRVINTAFLKMELKEAEKQKSKCMMRQAAMRKLIRPDHLNDNGGAARSLHPPPFNYPPANYPGVSPFSYLDAYPQVASHGYGPYGYGMPYTGSSPYGDIHHGLNLPGYTLGGVNSFILPDGSAVQENVYQPPVKPASDLYSWRSYHPNYPHPEGKSMFTRNPEGDYD